MTTTETNLSDVPSIPTVSAGRQAALASFWFASNLLWGAWLMIILPSQMKVIAPENPAQTQGAVAGWGSIPAIFVPILAGALSDRCRSRWGKRRPFMALGVGINLAGLAMVWQAGVTRSFWLYLIGYFVIQIGNNIATGAYSGVIPDQIPEKQRGSASGWMAAFSQLGTIAGVVSAGLLLSAGMIGVSYLVIAVSIVLFLFTTSAAMRDVPSEPSTERLDWGAFLRSFWIDPRKHPNFAWVWLTRLLVGMGLWTVQQFMQYYLTDVIGVTDPEKQAGFVLMAGLLCATISGIFGGNLSDKVGRRPIVYAANTIIALAAFGFIFCHSLTAVYIVGAIFGLGYGAYYSVDWALGCDVLPNKDDAAKDMGIWHISMVLPQSIALPISGIVLGAFGTTYTLSETGTKIAHYSTSGYTAIFGLAATYLLLGAVLLRNVRGVR